MQIEKNKEEFDSKKKSERKLSSISLTSNSLEISFNESDSKQLNENKYEDKCQESSIVENSIQ